MRFLAIIFSLLLAIGTTNSVFAEKHIGETFSVFAKDNTKITSTLNISLAGISLPHEISEKYSGQTLLITPKISISEKGSLDDVQIMESSGDNDIDNAVVTAIKKTKFNIAYSGEKAVPYTVIFPMKFIFKNDTKEQDKSNNEIESRE